MQSSGSRGDSSQNDALRVDRVGVLHARAPPAASTSRATSSSICSRHERSLLALRAAAAARAASPRVADEVDLHRVADRRASAASMSICTPRAWPSFGQELRVGEARADHQQRVAARSSSRSSASCRAGRSSRSRTAGRRAATALPSSAFATPAPSVSATSTPRRSRRSAPAPTSIATFSPALRISAARSQLARRAARSRGVDVADRRSASARARAAAPRRRPAPARRSGR